MPAWSTEIANDFIRLAARDGRAFDQIKLQELVYIAHGWCLAISGQPLTGDRPEAMPYGPEYRRLAKALAEYGSDPITREIPAALICADAPGEIPDGFNISELDEIERDVLDQTYHDFGGLEAVDLAKLTRLSGTPWEDVFAAGAGKFADISHQLIRAQFVSFAKKRSS